VSDTVYLAKVNHLLLKNDKYKGLFQIDMFSYDLRTHMYQKYIMRTAY